MFTMNRANRYNLQHVADHVKGRRKRFPKLVKMSVLFIKIKFRQRYILKLALIASHMDKYATALIQILQKTTESDIMFGKHRRQTFAVTLLNLRYVFCIVLVKRIKRCFVPYIIM